MCKVQTRQWWWGCSGGARGAARRCRRPRAISSRREVAAVITAAISVRSGGRGGHSRNGSARSLAHRSQNASAATRPVPTNCARRLAAAGRAGGPRSEERGVPAAGRWRAREGRGRARTRSSATPAAAPSLRLSALHNSTRDDTRTTRSQCAPPAGEHGGGAGEARRRCRRRGGVSRSPAERRSH